MQQKNQAKGRGDGVLFVCKLFPSINVTCQRLLSFLLLFIGVLPARKKCHFRNFYNHSKAVRTKKVGSKSTYGMPRKVQCFWQVHTQPLSRHSHFSQNFDANLKNWLFFKLVIWIQRYYTICFACCTQE